MYLHLGQNVTIPAGDVIGVFDLEITSQSKRTREFLAAAERAKQVETVCDDLPRAFVVCDRKVYITQLSSATLQKRANNTTKKE